MLPPRTPTDPTAYIGAYAAFHALGAETVEEAQTWARAAELLRDESLGAVGDLAGSGAAVVEHGEPERAPGDVRREGIVAEEGVSGSAAKGTLRVFPAPARDGEPERCHRVSLPLPRLRWEPPVMETLP